MRKVIFAVALSLIVLFSSGVWAQGVGIPVDIPGTVVNFFLYRYEGDQKPYNQVNAIWANLSAAFDQWVVSTQDPADLSGKDVHIVVNASGSVSVFLKDHFIVEVDQYHAKINRATPQQLAEKWAANLREGVEKFVSINQPKPVVKD